MALITGSTTIDWSGVSLDPIDIQQDFNNFSQRFNDAISEIQLGHYSLNAPPSATLLSVTLDSGGIVTATGTGLDQTNPVVTSFEYSNPSTGDVVSLAGTIDFVGKEVVNRLTIGFPGVQQTIIGNISVDLSSGNASGSITQLQETLGSTELTLNGSLILSGNFNISGNVSEISVVDGANTILMSGLLLPYSALGSVTTVNDLFSVVGNLMSGNDTITYTNNSGVGMTFFGGAGNDTITISGPNADTLNGGLGTDSLAGGLGDDTYVVDNLGDSVTENLNEGTDLVQSSVSYTLGANLENLTLTGAGAITGTGNALNNSLTGNGAANVLDGQGGADQMAGGGGNDTYLVDDAGDTVTENLNSGNDLVKSSVSFTLGDNVENLTLTGTDNLTGMGNASHNVLRGNAGNNVLDGKAGNDNMAGGLGDDTYVVDAAGDVVTEALNAGTDTVQSSINYTLGANLENLELTGSANLNGTGNALTNVLTGNSGNNTLSGGAGQDTVVGGLGDDQIIMLVTAGNVDTVDAGDGTDTLVLSGVVPGNHEVVVDLSSATDQVVSIGGVLDNTLTQVNFENLNAAGIGSFVTVTGSAGANNIIGSNGNDTITGGGGNDTLNGGLGADSLAGGLGDDTYVVDNLGDSVTENFNEGTDLVQSSVSYTLGPNLENLTLTGAGAITGTGNALNNSLTGNGAANVLDGQGGADQMAGGGGNDTYLVDDAGDTVTENLNSGNDLVKSSVSFTLGDNVENLTLTGTDNLTGTGNASHNVLRGNAGNNVLDGKAGNDNMAGGLGDDTYVVDAAGDVVTEALNAGTDTVQSSINYTLGANLENLELTGSANLNGTGNGLNNSITGNSGNNTLSGGVGQDTVVGGLGDDQIIMLVTAGNVDTVDAGDGTDTLVLSGVVPGNHEVVVDLSSATDQVVSIGGVLDNTLTQVNFENLNAAGIGSFVTVTGSAGANNIIGSNGNDTITGGGGNDTLNGGLGADSLAGGLGDDTYVVDNLGDSVTENFNEGTDLVQSSVSYTLGPNLENLTLTGAGAITGTGNALNNSLTGNGAANVLDGQGGADQMAGGGGNDTYLVDDAGDTVTENLNSGNDLVKSSVSFTLGDNVENLTLTGTDNLTGTGNASHNVLRGNAGNNVLDGKAGNDNMAGGLGDDTYVVDAAGDVVTEALNAGTDTVQSSINYTLGANLENLELTGSANLNGTGNGLNNSITGNSGNNTLSGGAGQDTVVGGLGDDQIIMLVTAGNVDTVDAGDGTDTLVLSGVVPGNHEVVVDLSSATDQVVSIGGVLDNTLTQVNFENLNAAGIGSFVTVTGSAGANNIIGSNGNDTITGGDGNDTLSGLAGNDTLNGGAGNDTLIGGAGNDTFDFGLGGGQDLIQDSSGSADEVSFDSGINPLDLVISRQANDLRLAIHGTPDQITVQNWYVGTTNRTETIQAGNNQVLLSTQVDQLVQAMAQFTTDTGLSWDAAIDGSGTAQQQTQFQGIIAASWQ